MTDHVDTLAVGSTVAYQGRSARLLDGTVTPCDVDGTFVVLAKVGDVVTLRDARHDAGELGDDARDERHDYYVDRDDYNAYAAPEQE